MSKGERWDKTGLFDIGDGKELRGKLVLDGRNSLLTLFSDQFISTKHRDLFYVRGVLDDLTKVSLIDCLYLDATTFSKRGQVKYLAKFFPHYVTLGENYLDPESQGIIEAEFLLDYSSTLFYDFDAFGHIIKSEALIEQVVAANKLNRVVPIGSCPQIVYFTGKTEICSAETEIGKLYVRHSISYGLGGPRGVSIKNKVKTGLSFEFGVSFAEAIDRVYKIRNYLGLLVGRGQRLTELRVRLADEDHRPIVLNVHWSWKPGRKRRSNARGTHPRDVLIDGVHAPEAFSEVTKRWFERDKDWSTARARFFTGFFKQGVYDVDRLIRAANMFDILPVSAVPAMIALPEDLQEAKLQARTVFRKLPLSPERESVLDVLGRVGKASLKRKIRHRAQIVIDKLPGRLHELLLVVDAAVDCRNYFVHGNEAKLPYDKDEEVIWFFYDTLEFIFAVSDLIEAGWNPKEWVHRSSVTHPLKAYLDSYPLRLEGLRKLIQLAQIEKA